MLGLTILGAPTLHRDGAALPLTIKKTLALVILLARSPAPLPRARVAALLWPTLDEAIGRRNLRRELARLREVGAGEAVIVDGDRLALADTVACDVDAFEAALAAGRPEDALDLWRGSPADGFALGDADAFDEWLALQREQLQERRRVALRGSAAAREGAGDLAGALARIEALLGDDPLQEQHHRDAMRLLAAAGRREAALAQYERCRTLLSAELGLMPMAETEALAASVRGAMPAPVHSQAVAPAAPRSLADARRARLPEVLPFVGRNAEVARLEEAWASGRTIVVEGEAGVGKTRLATDFAASHGAYALARCRAGDGELPYASFTRALRALMGPALPELPEWIGHELARLMPELGAPPAPIRSDEERSRFFEACARGWEALSAENFDAIVLDDWHLADGASRTLLAFVTQRRTEGRAQGAREMLLLRPDLDAVALTALRALIASTGAAHLRLQTLAGDAVLELVERLSGASKPVRFAGRLVRATGGNPFFLAETLRHLVETELLSADAGGGWQTPFDDATEDYRELPMPASVLDTVRARVDRLSAPTRRILETAALASEPFLPSLLAPACALSELEAVFAIEQAVESHLLREHDSGGFAFAHDLVQQAINDTLSVERRRLVHRRLALGGEAAGAPAATIAAHHEASGDWARAVIHRIAAGDQAQRLHALAEAMMQWLKALADGPVPQQAIQLHERLLWAGRERSEPDVIQAQADALGALLAGSMLSAHQRIEAAIVRSFALATSSPEQALIELDALPGLPNDQQRARQLRARSMALHNLGRSDEAMLVARAALALPDLPDVDRIELLDMLFISDHNAGRVESALAHADAELELSTRTGNAHGIARARYRRGLQLLQLHQVAEAEAQLLAAVEDCRRSGFVRTERVALYNLTCVYSSLTQPVKALAAAQRAWALDPPLRAGPLRAVLGMAMVDANLALGDLGAAWEHVRQALDDALAQDESAVRMIAAVYAMEPLALIGESALARRLLASIGDDALRVIANAASEMWVALAQFELKQGDAAAAERALARLSSAGGLVEERVRVRHAQAHAALALAQGDAKAALALLPADDTVGMNAEMHTRGLAIRVGAEARLGGLQETTAAAVRSALAAPSHRIASLELQAALAEAAKRGVPGVARSAIAAHDAFVAALVASLAAHPVQQAAFRRAWS